MAVCGLLCCDAAQMLTAPSATIAPRARTDATEDPLFFFADARFLALEAVRGLRFAVAMRNPVLSFQFFSFNDRHVSRIVLKAA